MSEHGSTSLLDVVFYSVALFALLVWSFRHFNLPW